MFYRFKEDAYKKICFILPLSITSSFVCSLIALIPTYLFVSIQICLVSLMNLFKYINFIYISFIYISHFIHTHTYTHIPFSPSPFLHFPFTLFSFCFYFSSGFCGQLQHLLERVCIMYFDVAFSFFFLLRQPHSIQCSHLMLDSRR